MIIGAHITITKGLDKACLMTEEIGGNAFQFFTRNPRGGKARDIDKVEIELFAKSKEEKGIFPAVGHLPYTVNLAAENESTYAFAGSIVGKDLERAEAAGFDYLVVHPGRNKDRQAGLKKMILLLEERLAAYNFKKTMLLLESMVGGGTELGTLEDLKITLDFFNKHEGLGICLDTCHLFASGWDLRKKSEVDKLVGLLNDYFGLNRIKLVHLNDSLFPFKSYKDRHAPIGEGHLGDEGIRNVAGNEFLGNLPLILETPVDNYLEYGKEIERVNNLL